MRQKQKPPLYRLTLTSSAFSAVAAAKLFKIRAAFERPDGRINVAISWSLFDQLQTAALPKENLSDTVLRIMQTEKS